MRFKVAIVGRPNVGKSTLFNRLVGQRVALVDATPGVTRDRRYGDAQLEDLKFEVIDTAGLEEAFDDSLEARMRRQTELAVEEADFVLLLVDARAGVTPLDRHFANWLRRLERDVAVIANKCEGRQGVSGLAEAHGLGLGEPLPLSAEHGEGFADLFRLIDAQMPAALKPAPPAKIGGKKARRKAGEKPNPQLRKPKIPRRGKRRLTLLWRRTTRGRCAWRSSVAQMSVSRPW